MPRLLHVAVALWSLGVCGAWAQDGGMLNDAIAGALEQFETALPQIDGSAFDVDVRAYRDALSLQRFSSARWGGEVEVLIQTRNDESGGCARFAAFTQVPPRDGQVPLVLCPRFFTVGADELRRLTILHEMAHVVAGTDECQAMSFAARVEHLSTGRWTPVDSYWRASGCAGGRYSLPN